MVAPYPPGIPALAPGEVVSAELVAALRGEVAGGTRMAGVSDTSLATLFVVAESWTSSQNDVAGPVTP